MPRVLTDTAVANFRDRASEAAERLFAEQGPGAVTMRQLASELGVSPMTPYRYFEDKDEILASVRANSFARFVEVLDAARASADGARARGAAAAEAYLAFALQNARAYKLMFDFNQPQAERYPGLAAGPRGQKSMTAYIQDALAEGLTNGDSAQLALTLWAAIHGAVILELAGMAPPGGAREIYRTCAAAMMRAQRPED